MSIFGFLLITQYLKFLEPAISRRKNTILNHNHLIQGFLLHFCFLISRMSRLPNVKPIMDSGAGVYKCILMGKQNKRYQHYIELENIKQNNYTYNNTIFLRHECVLFLWSLQLSEHTEVCRLSSLLLIFNNIYNQNF